MHARDRMARMKPMLHFVPIIHTVQVPEYFLMIENEASLKVLKKSGFTQVGNNIIESSVGKHESLRMELANRRRR